MNSQSSPFRVMTALLFALTLSSALALAQSEVRRETVAVTYPSSASRLYTRAAVRWFTPASPATARVVGSFSPGSRSPSSIALVKRSTSCCVIDCAVVDLVALDRNRLSQMIPMRRKQYSL